MGRDRRGPQEGNTLVLVPAAVLILLLLSSLAIDSASTFLAQRDLADACEAAANDAATVALDRGDLYGGGPSTPVVDAGAAAAEARAEVAPLGQRWGSPVRVDAPDTSGGRIRLRFHADVPLVLAPALPGHPAKTSVSASCEAQPVP